MNNHLLLLSSLFCTLRFLWPLAIIGRSLGWLALSGALLLVYCRLHHQTNSLSSLMIARYSRHFQKKTCSKYWLDLLKEIACSANSKTVSKCNGNFVLIYVELTLAKFMCLLQQLFCCLCKHTQVKDYYINIMNIYDNNSQEKLIARRMLVRCRHTVTDLH